MIFPTELARTLIRRGLLKENVENPTFITEKVAAFQAMCLTESIDDVLLIFGTSLDNPDLSNETKDLLILLHKATNKEIIPAIIISLTDILNGSDATAREKIQISNFIKTVVEGENAVLDASKFPSLIINLAE